MKVKYSVNDVFETVFVSDGKWAMYNHDEGVDVPFYDYTEASEAERELVAELWTDAKEVSVEELIEISECQPLIDWAILQRINKK